MISNQILNIKFESINDQIKSVSEYTALEQKSTEEHWIFIEMYRIQKTVVVSGTSKKNFNVITIECKMTQICKNSQVFTFSISVKNYRSL